MGHGDEQTDDFAEQQKKIDDAIAAFKAGSDGGGGGDGSGVVTAAEAAELEEEAQEEEDLGPLDPETWQLSVWGYIQQEASAQAEALGMSDWEYSLIMGQTRQKIFDWTFDWVKNRPGNFEQNLDYITTDPNAISLLLTHAWNRFSALNGMFGEFTGAGGASRGGGGGSRRPTAQDIRNRFDIDALSQQANSIWRNILLTTPANSRSLAKSYVDQVVAGKGEKALDFNAFVRKKAMETNRFAVIYENKPEDLEPEAYLQRYAQSAAAVLRPANVEDIAIGAARFGSDSGTFGARLERTDEVTGSSAYINGLENRMRNLNKVFKG